MPDGNDFSIDRTVALRRLDIVIWGIIGLAGAVILLSPVATDFKIVWRSFYLPVSASALLVSGSWFYSVRRCDPRLSSALGGTAQLVMFSAVGAPLSYLAASAGLPLQDSVFDTADKALGFDWIGWLGWLNSHPTIFHVFRIIYFSLSIQLAIAVLCLAFTGRLAWLRVFLLAFMCAAVVTIAISIVLPSQSTWIHFGLTAADPSSIVPATRTSWPVFSGLRDGTYRELLAAGAEGIITFPSLHSALAVILIAAIWPMRTLRWPILAIDAVMLFATPIDGAHYFVDVLAGASIAAVSLAIANAVLQCTMALSAPHNVAEGAIGAEPEAIAFASGTRDSTATQRPRRRSSWP